VEVLYTESFTEFYASVCRKVRYSPINIYFLGNDQTLDGRIKFLFEVAKSPIGSPDKKGDTPDKKGDINLKAKSHTSSETPRSGQSALTSSCLRRDSNLCVFCDGKDNLTAAPMVSYKFRNNVNIESLFEKCVLSSVQDVANAITLCRLCHEQFDNHFVAVNPETNFLEVSNALLSSEDADMARKWQALP
jgi:hypothetical protein